MIHIKCLLDKLSKYLLFEIKLYIPFLHILKLFKYNKYYQEKFDIKFSTYKILFHKNKMEINFENVDKEKKNFYHF